MKKSFVILFLAVLAMALVAPVQIHAANPTPKPAKTPKGATHTTIAAVDASSITVNEGTQAKTYKINSFTEIDYNGNTAKVTDLKTGMRVEVTAGMDPAVADRISASDAPAATPKKK